MRQDRQNWHSIYLILVLILIVLMAVPYLDYTGVLPKWISSSKQMENINNKWSKLGVKVFYVVMLPFLTSLLFSIKVSKTTKDGERKIYIVIYILLSLLIIVGTINNKYFIFYNVLFLPLILFTHLFIASRAFSEVLSVMDDEDILGLSKVENDSIGHLKFDVDLEDGTKDHFNVHNIFQGMYVTGGAGSGKSASIVVPALWQWIRQGMSLSIYDFKGDPATLGLFAYNAWKHWEKNNDAHKYGLKYPTYELISFTELEKSSRPNPFSPKSMKSNLESKEMVSILLAALNPSFVGKRDYWADSALAMGQGITERLRQNYPSYCTIPHLAAIGVLNVSDVLKWLNKNDFVKKQMAVYESAQGSAQTFASMVASFQMEMTKLLDENIFYIMGAKEEDQSDLDLNKKDNPRIMSVSDNKDLHAGAGPVISCILAAIKKNINNQGKHPHFMVIDEYPQLYLEVADLPATGRSNKASILVAVQDESQLVRKYKKEFADELIANLGTQFYGMSNNDDTARRVSEMLGTVKKQDDSYSYSEDGVNFSKRMQQEKVLQGRDIKGQATGHFTGKIAGGEPPIFSAQFSYWDPSKHLNEVDQIEQFNLPDSIMHVYNNDPKLAMQIFNSYKKAEFYRIMSEAAQIVYGTIEEEIKTF